MYWVNGLYTITVNGVPTFQAANPGAGIPNGTEITNDWLADVQGELLNFLNAANIAPAVSTPTQVKAATDFLYARKYGIATAPVTVTPAMRGMATTCNPGCTSVTLPGATTFDGGFTVGFYGGETGTTINVVDEINDGDSLSGLATFVLGPNSFIWFQAQGVNWGVLSASADLQLSGDAGATGFQFLPSGAIDQWGGGNTGTGGNVVVTFPKPFSSAVGSIVVTVNNETANVAGTTNLGVGDVSLTGFTVFSDNASGADGPIGFYWRAVGK